MTKIRLQNQQSCVQQARATYQQTTVIWSQNPKQLQNTAAWEPKYYSTSFHLPKKKEHKTPKSQTTQPTESKLLKHSPQTQFPSPTKPKPKTPPKKYKFRFKSSWFPTPSHQNTNSTKKPSKDTNFGHQKRTKMLKKRYLAFIEINSITSSHETSTSLSTECRKTKSKTSI